MATKKGPIDPGEYEVRKFEKSPVQALKEMLEALIGRDVQISSNLERYKQTTKKKITLYHVGQQYNEMGQVLTLENPSLKPEDVPMLPISPNMEIRQEGSRIILRYPKAVSFKGLVKRTLPDLEIYIEEVVKQ